VWGNLRERRSNQGLGIDGIDTSAQDVQGGVA
jgi:hypothetical protein